MFFSRDGQTAILLLAVTEGFVLASTSDDKNNVKVAAATFISSIHVPLWIDSMEFVMHSSGSSCAEEIAALSEAIRAQEIWALKMLDASSKIQSGILQGNIVDLGMYSECVGVDGKYNNVNVRGKHCMVTFGFEAFRLTSSVCIPSACNETQASQIMSYIIENLLVNSSLKIETLATTATCARVGSEDFTVAETLTIAFFSAVGAFILVCTICDYVERSWPEKTSVAAVHTLAKFSLYTNALILLSTEVKPGTMAAVNGIRFMSTSWIFLEHFYSVLSLEPMVNSSDYFQWSTSWNAVWVDMSTFATDNFFLVSGFLMSFLFFKSMRSRNEFNLPMMYLRRYVRLTPGVAVATLFVTVLFHRMGNGPFWKSSSSSLVRGCEENWWVNLLYSQNFLSTSDICLLQTWFLAADMQLFVISPIILYPLHRWPRYGLWVLSLFLLISVVTPSVVVGLGGYSIVSRRYPDPSGRFEYYHIRSYTRAFPYLLGILLAHEITTRKRKLSQVTVVCNWIVACVLMMFCIVVIHYLLADIENYPALDIASAAIVRPCWSIAIAWIIYACTQGYGGVIAKFLSLPIFLPLCRLSYGIYLVHLPVILFKYGTITIPGIFLDSVLLISILGLMVTSISVSVVISLFFEYPVMVLEEILKKRTPRREPVAAVEVSPIPRSNDSEHQVEKGIQD